MVGVRGLVGSECCEACPVQRASLEALIKEAKMSPVDFEELSRLQELVKSAEVLIVPLRLCGFHGFLVGALVRGCRSLWWVSLWSEQCDMVEREEVGLRWT